MKLNPCRAVTIQQQIYLIKPLLASFYFLFLWLQNTFIEIIVFETKTLKKPINLLMVNMAISDMFVPIFLFPRILV